METYQIVTGLCCLFFGVFWAFLMECIIPRVEYDEETDTAIIKIRKENKEDDAICS